METRTQSVVDLPDLDDLGDVDGDQPLAKAAQPTTVEHVYQRVLDACAGMERLRTEMSQMTAAHAQWDRKVENTINAALTATQSGIENVRKTFDFLIAVNDIPEEQKAWLSSRAAQHGFTMGQELAAVLQPMISWNPHDRAVLIPAEEADPAYDLAIGRGHTFQDIIIGAVHNARTAGIL